MNNKIININTFEINKIPALKQVDNTAYKLLNAYLSHDYAYFEEIFYKDAFLCDLTLKVLSFVTENQIENIRNTNMKDMLINFKHNTVFNYECALSLILGLSLQRFWLSSLDLCDTQAGKEYYLEHMKSILYIAYKIFLKNSFLQKQNNFADIILILSTHNIGLGILSGLFKIEYNLLLCLAKKNPNSSLLTLEKNLSAMKISTNLCSSGFICHAKIGAIALNKWGLPQKFVESILWHYLDYSGGQFENYIYFLQLCDFILAKYNKSYIKSKKIPNSILKYFDNLDLNMSLTWLETKKDKEADFDLI